MTESLIQFLQANGFNPENFSINALNENRETALMCAAKEGNIAIAKELLDLGANPDQTDEFMGNTPLILAAKGNHTDFIQLLLDRKADPNLGDIFWGETALLWATQYGNKEAVLALLKSGIPVNQTSRNGRTALSYAADSGREELIRILLKNKADINHRKNEAGTPIAFAALSRRKQTVEFLLQSKADLSLKAGSLSPLHIARICNDDVSEPMLHQIAFQTLIEARNLRKSIQSKDLVKDGDNGHRLKLIFEFKNRLQQFVMQFSGHCNIIDEKKQQEINACLLNILESVLKQTLISPALYSSMIFYQGLIQNVFPNLGRDVISRILGFLHNGYGETVQHGIEKLYAEYAATISQSVFFYFKRTELKSCYEIAANGTTNPELFHMKKDHQKLLAWQKKDKDDLEWEKFKKNYNDKFPRKEAEGYGPGTIIIKRF